jgi:hypothetical protein
MLFGCVSLVETGLVMFLHHQHSDDWDDALSPQGASRAISLVLRNVGLILRNVTWAHAHAHTVR